jgi:hypothetical protein
MILATPYVVACFNQSHSFGLTEFLLVEAGVLRAVGLPPTKPSFAAAIPKYPSAVVNPFLDNVGVLILLVLGLKLPLRLMDNSGLRFLSLWSPEYPPAVNDLW